MRDPTPLSSAHGPRLLPWAAPLILALVASLPLHPQVLEPGIVVMTTSPSEATKWQISLGPGFFDSGSDEAELEITFQGEPLTTAPGTPSLAHGDTVFQILEEAELDYYSYQGTTVHIRTVALNLVSAQPVTVTYGGANPELWDVRACLSDAPQLDGFLTLTPSPGCEWDGTFTATTTVRPKLIFKRRGDNTVRVLDPGSDPGSTGFIAYQASGYWINRNAPSGGSASYLEVAPGAVVDVNRDGVFDPAFPGTSDIILGLHLQCCHCFPSGLPYLSVQPVVQEIHQIHVVEPATRDNASFPLFEPGTQEPPARRGTRGTTELAGLAVLSLGAVFLPLRRK